MKFFPVRRHGIVEVFLFSAPVILSLLCSNTHLVKKNTSASLVKVHYQKIYLNPVNVNNALLFDAALQKEHCITKMVTDNLAEVGKNLLAEFRRCEKYGLYSMVDSMDSYSLEVTLTFDRIDLHNDTITIPATIMIRDKISQHKQSFRIITSGVSVSYPDSTTRCYRFGSAISDLRRRFPCREIVTRFYSSGEQGLEQ
jgi:hypothetical protein